jgi:hypothetical protein
MLANQAITPGNCVILDTRLLERLRIPQNRCIVGWHLSWAIFDHIDPAHLGSRESNPALEHAASGGAKLSRRTGAEEARGP